MINSILNSVKKDIGAGDPSFNVFDDTIINDINTVFFTLNQLGVGPKKTFRIEDSSVEWDDFFTGREDIDAVKTFMSLNVHLLFDPPTNGTVVNIMKEQIAELTWRLNVKEDPKEENADA